MQRQKEMQRDKSLTTIMTSFGAERFGVEEPKSSEPTLRRAEWHRRRRVERARKRSAFSANPFGFAKRLLRQKCSGHLECSKEEVDEYLFNTLRDPDREKELGPQRALLDVPAP